MSRPKRNLDQDWQELREWVQQHQGMIRLNGVALKAGVSPELVTSLLLRDPEKIRAARGFDRLDSLLEVFMVEPFGYRPSWIEKMWAKT
ncbi:hypothetical protein [Hymenobacter gelipurpurascens]|nr:hypothetical protein [Hymenobacter gelipurpurascens]